MLEVRGLNLFYGEIQALYDVSLTVDDGEIVALLGANGAGKSSTLKAISGLLRPRSGSCRFDGHELIGRPPEEIARLGVAHVPEGRRIFPGLSVLENLLVATAVRHSVTPKEIRESLDRVFMLFPRLFERKTQYGWSLSGGEQQMLAIARGLMARPRLLLLDEPSLGLAPKLVREVFGTIKEINAAGTTVLLAEQNAYLALRVAQRGFVMATGRIRVHDAAERLSQREDLRAAYLGG